ncbi:N(2)-acetyl-L-2,4-diaminobutanoate deacetylase DoeB2 [Gilvimarinus algae]|uniref:N(2)-acetyl-L-2,4-diaminobutanoate deacetylase DoeB2 n=1 Tax=Gilvimarinus algae TaxID=3058037 RepID=A0ABT8TAF5_9GAMM|nr:N(2)-acetyl-L-2,4-diaminobutanoate deacetylase DoeB2 [Gilvimarinus sp. SDUM040014]MDO3380988.1 N(2)-acetyl-L-2,4-diaminobutanoate deacetylase DoeB2 [Gilvimarinus sp. SDUM040014]
MTQYWQQLMNEAQQLRRQLHSEPELGWQETDTAARIRDRLTRLDIPWRACAATGTVATLRADAQGWHTALRGDIDALPIHERTELTWQSNRAGCMHACGHDGHTATLLTTAAWLKRNEAHLKGPVTLIFQPAEEGGHGAREMINDGALEGVERIYGWHNWPAIEFGKLVCPDGIVMCGNGTFEVALTGVGGHASQPELCRDPVLAASALVQALQQIVSRRLAPQQATVVSVTSIDAPSAPTVIPEKAVIGGSIRVSDQSARERVNALIEDIAQQVAAAYGVEASVTITPRYHPTINHPSAAQSVREAWGELYGSDSLDHSTAVPIMASEDFSYYLREIPGAFALIGADDGEAHRHPCHSPYYDFNDRLLEPVTRLYSQLVQAPLP